jgi:hypothetical protein
MLRAAAKRVSGSQPAGRGALLQRWLSSAKSDELTVEVRLILVAY